MKKIKYNEVDKDEVEEALVTLIKACASKGNTRLEGYVHAVAEDHMFIVRCRFELEAVEEPLEKPLD